MKSRYDIDRAISESRRIKRGLIIWLAVLLTCIVYGIIQPTVWDTEWKATGIIVASITSLVALALNLLMVSNLDDFRNYPDLPTGPPRRNPTDLMTFEATRHNRRPALVEREPNHIRVKLSRYKDFRAFEWLMILEALEGNKDKHGYRFTRECLRKTHLFEINRVGHSITATGVFPDIIRPEFDRMDWLERIGKYYYLSEKGLEELTILSGRQVITDVG